MKRPAPAAKSATKQAKKTAKKRVARPGTSGSGTSGAAWLKLVPSDKNEPLSLPETKNPWEPDHPGFHHAGDIGASCGGTASDDYINLDADLDFGAFQMPSVTKGGRKTTKKKLRSGRSRRGWFGDDRLGNPGKEIHQRWARVKAMSVNSALAKLRQFMAVTPENLDTRCRYPESNPLELILDGLDQECSDYQAVAEVIEEQLLDFMESEAGDSKSRPGKRGNRRNVKNRYQAVVVEACNEKRNGHVWGEENPKADMELLKKKRQKARPEERRKIEAQMRCLKRQWQSDSEDERPHSRKPWREQNPHNDSQILRHDAMIIYLAGAKSDSKGKMSGAKACARVALSKRIYRSCFVIDPWTGEL
eukprot:Skav201699  [mRNA]  locus=scaffold641:967831:968916:- [translate_table: standard]